VSASPPVALACPDCGARPEWVHDPTGWAKCSRCELVWPALERRFRGAPPKGAVVTLPHDWRLRRTKAGDSYRSEAKQPELRVELPPGLPVNSGILFGLAMCMTFATISVSLNGWFAPLVAVFSMLALACGVAGVVSFLRRPRRGLDVTFVGNSVQLARGGEPARDLGRLVRLWTNHRGEEGSELLLETSVERTLTLVTGARPEEVETLLREIGRHAGLTFDRRSGTLVAHRKPEPARVRAPDATELASETEPSEADAHADVKADAGTTQARRDERRR
jgi:hypothetical protein